jgi:hypothetical protein
MNKSKMLSILNIILFMGVLTINALANILPINNYNTGELSDMIPNLFVPAGITFSIWGVIYLLLAIFVIVNAIESFKDSEGKSFKINIFLALNFILNIFWILTWHYRLVPLSLLVMIGLFFTLLIQDNQLDNMAKGNYKNIYAITMGVYFGWISVATIANITALLVILGWSGFPLNEVTWTIIVVLIGSFIASLKLLKTRSIPYALVFIWAYSGIIIKRAASTPVYNSIIWVSIISIVFIVATGTYTFLRRRTIK